MFCVILKVVESLTSFVVLFSVARFSLLGLRMLETTAGDCFSNRCEHSLGLYMWFKRDGICAGDGCRGELLSARLLRFKPSRFGS